MTLLNDPAMMLLLFLVSKQRWGCGFKPRVSWPRARCMALLLRSCGCLLRRDGMFVQADEQSPHHVLVQTQLALELVRGRGFAAKAEHGVNPFADVVDLVRQALFAEHFQREHFAAVMIELLGDGVRAFRDLVLLEVGTQYIGYFVVDGSHGSPLWTPAGGRPTGRGGQRVAGSSPETALS